MLRIFTFVPVAFMLAIGSKVAHSEESGSLNPEGKAKLGVVNNYWGELQLGIFSDLSYASIPLTVFIEADGKAQVIPISWTRSVYGGLRFYLSSRVNISFGLGYLYGKKGKLLNCSSFLGCAPEFYGTYSALASKSTLQYDFLANYAVYIEGSTPVLTLNVSGVDTTEYKPEGRISLGLAIFSEFY
jgi:hypothetical protein